MLNTNIKKSRSFKYPLVDGGEIISNAVHWPGWRHVFRLYRQESNRVPWTRMWTTTNPTPNQNITTNHTKFTTQKETNKKNEKPTLKNKIQPSPLDHRECPTSPPPLHLKDMFKIYCYRKDGYFAVENCRRRRWDLPEQGSGKSGNNARDGGKVGDGSFYCRSRSKIFGICCLEREEKEEKCGADNVFDWLNSSPKIHCTKVYIA